ncbi:MAG: hypothetical protein EHM50_06820 [Lysobacterales bacterium]|nr:MAG: hypothetical protein EHM50_06820 [Xanthomonadales bacterium]
MCGCSSVRSRAKSRCSVASMLRLAATWAGSIQEPIGLLLINPTSLSQNHARACRDAPDGGAMSMPVAGGGAAGVASLAQILLLFCGGGRCNGTRKLKGGMRMRDQARALTRAIGYAWLCWATALAAQPAAQSDTGAIVRYEVQPSDVLQVSVWREPELTQQVLVRPDGAFSFPLAGDISAVGKTVEELRLELVERLGRYIPDLVVTVTVLEIRGNKIYVIGQVNQPGEFIVNPRVDVMQALSLAGGTTAFASPNAIFVLRRDNGQQRRLPFNFDAVLRGRDLEQNVLLRTGDVVVVP